jgi:hypothetical protein
VHKTAINGKGGEMARKKEYRIEFENPLTQEKMNYIKSQHSNKSMQQILDMAIDCLFMAEAENMQRNIARLMGNKPIEGDNQQ